MGYINDMIEDLSINTSTEQITFEDIVKEKLSYFKDNEDTIKNKENWEKVVHNDRLKKEHKLFYYYNVLGFLQAEERLK